MIAFLQEVAQNITQRYPGQINQLAFIFPNKRAVLFFQKHLSKILGVNNLAPGLFTISKVIEGYTKLKPTHKLRQLFVLFEVFNQIKQAKSPDIPVLSFDKFARLGEIILSDFDDIDNYLADPKQVFTNIRDLAEIEARFFDLSDEEKAALREFWSNFTAEKLSEEKQLFLQLWEDMPELYRNFHDRMLDRKWASEGAIHRKLSLLIDQEKIKLSKFKKFIVVGFSALNAAEHKLFTYLNANDMAEFFWDVDEYYTQNNHQEAGQFVRENIHKYAKNTQTTTPNNLLGKPKNVKTLGVPLFASQARVIPQLIEQLGIPASELNEQTAIILADEHLLFPVLSALPAEAQQLNVTMGYPFNSTTLYALIVQLLELQNQLGNERTGGYYYKNIVKILQHPSLQAAEPDYCRTQLQQIEENRIYSISPEALLGEASSLIKAALTPALTPIAFLRQLQEMLFILFNLEKAQQSEQDSLVIEFEYIYQAYIEIGRIIDTLDDFSGLFTFQFLDSIIRQYLGDIKIPFFGEPLQGMQIMGVLETRNIDFKNIIILSLNEGIWPSAGRRPSFISESLRRAFNLPQAKQLDAIFAYLFYRLIQRAENIAFVYNNLNASGHSGEASRLLLQLRYETNLNIQALELSQNLKPYIPKEITIEKSSEIMQHLAQFTRTNGSIKTGFSASAINTYLSCRLKFYFKYVAGIKETDEMDENLDAAEFGTILHHTLELGYTPYLGKILQPADFEAIEAKLDQNIEAAFREMFKVPADKPFTFRNEQLIIRKVVRKLAQNVLDLDKKLKQLEIIALEQKDGYVATLSISVGRETHEVVLKGIIDRIDRTNGTTRVIDYKSGKAEKSFTNWDSVFSREKSNHRKEVLQTFYYGLLYQTNHPVPLYPGIYDIRNINTPDFSPMLTLGSFTKKENIDSLLFQRELPIFTDGLTDLFTELYDPEIPFNQTPHAQHCQFCSYIQICGK